VTVWVVCIVVVTGIVTVLVTVSVVVIACAMLAGIGPVIARMPAITRRVLKISLRCRINRNSLHLIGHGVRLQRVYT